jgi:hypothetical protein
VAVNVVDVVPAGTVIEGAGTGSSALLLDSNTAVPLLGATLLSVTMHVVAAPEFKLLGLHANEERVTGAAGATRLTVAVCITSPGTATEAWFEYALSLPLLLTAVVT